MRLVLEAYSSDLNARRLIHLDVGTAWQESGSKCESSSAHRSRDVPLVAPLIDLLRSAMNVKAGDIRCTSVDGYLPPAGARTEDQLRAEVADARGLNVPVRYRLERSHPVKPACLRAR